MKHKILILLLLLLAVLQVEAKTNVRSSLAWMKNLGTTYECVLENPAFRLEVGSVPKFDFTNKTGLQVINDFTTGQDFTISTYWYWSKNVIATTYSKDKTTLYLNTRANPRPLKAMINTVFHERSHLLNYGHGDNSPIGKGRSVPYLIGGLAEKYVQGCQR